MVEHSDFRKLISIYFDGQSTAEETELVEAHLAKCPDCRKYWQVLQKLSSSLKTWPEETLSPDLEQKIKLNLQKVQQREGSPMNKHHSTFLTATFGGGVFVVLIACVLLGQLYTTRGIQGRLKDAHDYVGDQYAPATHSTASLALKQAPQAIARKSSNGAYLSSVDKKVDQLALNYNFRGRDASQYLAKGSGTTQDAGQYEPYYATRAYDVRRETAVRAGQESTTYSGSGLIGQGETEDVEKRESRMAFLGAVVAKESPYRLSAQSVVSQSVGSYYPQYQYPPSTEEYASLAESNFQLASKQPLSTFAVDVDTASYSNIRRFLNQGQLPPAEAVRIEEMLNYFHYDYPTSFNQPVAITAEGIICPWNQAHRLVMVGLKARTPNLFQKQPPSNLVFLIDVSGSMSDPYKLDLLKQSLRSMVQQLRNDERVAIVTYANGSNVVLNSTPGSQKNIILTAINGLYAAGGTNGGAGIQTAYQIARQNYIEHGNNRVILATDGDFNVGITNDFDLVNLIKQEKESGVFLTVLGVGTGNYKDSKMEQLADKGNGNYFYLDSLAEGEKVLTRELGSTILTVAKDVKIQVEFNPDYVQSYRLIGYEDRKLGKKDFNNDNKDGGEMGAGHTVTALYEIVPVNAGDESGVDPLKYQKVSAPRSPEVLTVKVRFKQPDEDTSKLISRTLKYQDLQRSRGSDNIQLAASVAEFGMLLRNSPLKGSASYAHVLHLVQSIHGPDTDGYRAEFTSLVNQAAGLDYRYPRGVENWSNEEITDDVNIPDYNQPVRYQTK